MVSLEVMPPILDALPPIFVVFIASIGFGVNAFRVGSFPS